MILLLVITDGRDHIHQTIPSALEHLQGLDGPRIIYDDSGDEANGDRLADAFCPYGFDIIGGQRRGFGGAIRYCWDTIVATHGCDHVFHLEDDFTFNRPVPLSALANVLDSHPYLAQLALRRQPWNEQERDAGGIVEQHPSDYREVEDVFGRRWLEHRRFFTTNPCLYRRAVTEAGWPDVAQSEGMFTHQLIGDGFPGVDAERVRFGYWGARDSGEWVHHIGHERAGTGY